MLTTGRPATIPANATTPSPAARTAAPGAAARSTPRCPAPYGPAGGSNARVTAGVPFSGQPHAAAGTAGDGSATAGTGASSAGTRTARRSGRARTPSTVRGGRDGRAPREPPVDGRIARGGAPRGAGMLVVRSVCD